MAIHTTRVNTKWPFMQLIYILVLTAFGGWCVLDGAVWLPNRGKDDASYKQFRYLDAAFAANVREPADISVADPQKELAELNDPAKIATLNERRQASEASRFNAEFQLARGAWLQSLKFVNMLDTAHTTIADPAKTHADLKARWEKSATPKPLSQLDIPLQWVYLGVTVIVDLLVIFVLIRTVTRKYRYDDQTKTLTLPGGKQVTPADLAEVDKRKWEKLRCTVVLNDGTRADMDLLRYIPLEEWVLEIEAAAGKGEAPKTA